MSMGPTGSTRNDSSKITCTTHNKYSCMAVTLSDINSPTTLMAVLFHSVRPETMNLKRLWLTITNSTGVSIAVIMSLLLRKKWRKTVCACRCTPMPPTKISRIIILGLPLQLQGCKNPLNKSKCSFTALTKNRLTSGCTMKEASADLIKNDPSTNLSNPTNGKLLTKNTKVKSYNQSPNKRQILTIKTTTSTTKTTTSPSKSMLRSTATQQLNTRSNQSTNTRDRQTMEITCTKITTLPQRNI